MVDVSEASLKGPKTIAWIERETTQAIESLYFDGGPEFIQANHSLEENNFDTDVSTHYTSASNGLPERHVGLKL